MKTLDKHVENAFLADCCVKLALAVFADEADAKVQAEEILRDLNALPRPRLKIAHKSKLPV